MAVRVQTGGGLGNFGGETGEGLFKKGGGSVFALGTSQYIANG